MKHINYKVNKNLIFLYIRECGSTLYVGLMGIVRMLIQKSTWMVPPFLRLFFLRLKRASADMDELANAVNPLHFNSSRGPSLLKLKSIFKGFYLKTLAALKSPFSKTLDG